jgi:DNA-binding NtrC family response regulator
LTPFLEERHYALHRLLQQEPAILGRLAEMVVGLRWEVEVLDDESAREGYRFGEESLPDFLERIETAILRRAMVRTDYNVAEAARLLGVKRTTLQAKLQRMEWRTHDASDVDCNIGGVKHRRGASGL